MVQMILRGLLISCLFLQTLNSYSQETAQIESATPIEDVNPESEKQEKKYTIFPKITKPYSEVTERDIDYMIVRRVVETFTGPINPKTGKNPVNWTVDLYRHFVDEHWKYGVQEEIEWSLAYGYSGIGLRCNYRAKNGCAGPLDIPRGSTNPYANITAHCKEAREYRNNNRTGYALMKKIFYPKIPHDWNRDKTGKGRIWRAKVKIDECIQRGIEVGKIPKTRGDSK
jgi:hypothetical protein